MLYCGCSNNRWKEKPVPKSVTIVSLTNTGVIIDKNDGMGEGYTLVFRTTDDIVRERTTRDIFNYLNVGDTIKVK